MRIYKIGDNYIDLDHVLLIDKLLLHWEPKAWAFDVCMMFLNKAVTIYLWPTENRSIEAEDFKAEAEKQYDLFLKAWQNTPEAIAEKHNQQGGFVNSGVTILYDDKYLYLSESNGQPFRNQVSCVINDRVNDVCTATIVVNVSGFKRLEFNHE